MGKPDDVILERSLIMNQLVCKKNTKACCLSLGLDLYFDKRQTRLIETHGFLSIGHNDSYGLVVSSFQEPGEGWGGGVK